MDLATLFLTLGGLFLVGLAADVLGRRTFLPRVSLLLGLGFLLGPSGLGWIEGPGERWLPIVADMALMMVGFLIGGSLSSRQLRTHGRFILVVSLAKVIGAFVVVAGGLLVLGFRLEVALLFGAISSSTAPAAILDVIRERRAEGAFADSLLGIVAVDDAWGLILFSLALAAIEALVGANGGSALWLGLRDLGGAVVLGLAVGVPTALLSGRIEEGEPTQAEALAAVFLCGGLALWLEVSMLLAAMALGAVVVNLARHHTRPFHSIEGIEWPFMILFFAFAGASLELQEVAGAAGVLSAYVLLRSAGSVLGVVLGDRVAGDGEVDPSGGRWLGLALLPQAGVAMGMALVASQRLPELGQQVVPVVIASTALFELVGPVLTRAALDRAGAGPGGRVGSTGDAGLDRSTD